MDNMSDERKRITDDQLKDAYLKLGKMMDDLNDTPTVVGGTWPFTTPITTEMRSVREKIAAAQYEIRTLLGNRLANAALKDLR